MKHTIFSHPILKITITGLMLLMVLVLTEQVVFGISWTVSRTNFLSGVTAKGKVEVFPSPYNQFHKPIYNH